MVQPRNTGNCPDMSETVVDWDVKHQKQTFFIVFLPFSTIGPRHEKTCLRGFANNTGTDQRLISALFAFWKILVSYVNLLQVKFQFSSWSLYLRKLVCNSICRKPQRQVFSQRSPIIVCTLFCFSTLIAYI